MVADQPKEDRKREDFSLCLESSPIFVHKNL